MTTSKKEFISEAEDLLESAQGLTLELQESVEKGGVNPDSVNALFRDMHTLKGLSGLFGLQGITELSHKLESLLDDLRLGKVEATEEFCEFLLENVDVLRSLIKEDKGENVDDVSGYLKSIEDFIKGVGIKESGISLKGKIDDAILSVLSEYEEHRLKTNIQEGNFIYSLKVMFALEDFDTQLVTPGSIGFNLIVGSLSSQEELSDVLDHGLDVLVTPQRKVKSVENKIDDPGASLKSISTTVRVDIDKLDGILNTIGELNLAKGAVKRIGKELFEDFGYKQLIIDTYKVAQSLEKWVSALQDQVLDIRMIPIGQIFSRLAQIIRRYSRQSNKKINLHMFGEDTNIDKYLAEEAVDPLMHIVRNAIDHGIESEEERLANGKSPEGNITLRAFQRGNHVVVEVTDDGGGIDIDNIKEKAAEKGLIAKGEDYSDKEVIELIFMPGFSTATEITEVSGRGVGMDIVKERLSALGGFVSVESKKDHGSTLSVTLPITLAILKSLMVRVGSERFAIPLTSISESFEIFEDTLQTIEGRLIVDLRGEMLPILYIGDVFDVSHDEGGGNYVVVVGFGERKMGFLVDELFGQHEIVIKTMGEYFAGLKGFAGATEIGKHEIVLVVDVEAIIENSLVKRKERSHV
jgi:two-component system chemotaxis sensor kinase CheA